MILRWLEVHATTDGRTQRLCHDNRKGRDGISYVAGQLRCSMVADDKHSLERPVCELTYRSASEVLVVAHAGSRFV